MVLPRIIANYYGQASDYKISTNAHVTLGYLTGDFPSCSNRVRFNSLPVSYFTILPYTTVHSLSSLVPSNYLSDFLLDALVADILDLHFR